MTEGGKNYKLDELIGYYLIYLHYIIIPTTPNLSNLPLPTKKIKKLIYIKNLGITKGQGFENLARIDNCDYFLNNFIYIIINFY